MQDNKSKDKKSLKGKWLAILGINSFVIVNATLFSLFGSLYRYELKSFLWPLSIILLVVDLLIWIMPQKDERSEKYKRSLKNCRIIILIIGGTLFIVNSFVFTKNIVYSFMLITIALFVFVGFISVQKFLK